MNTHQLVIRCDTANGYYKVGWASELPLGRFQHIELLCDSETHFILDINYSVYKKGCDKVFGLNKILIENERTEKQSLGWQEIALNLNNTDIKILPDTFGCFYSLASEARYRLSKNSAVVWAVIKNTVLIQIEARYPKQKITELKYQIWKHHRLKQLRQYGGQIKQGRLIPCNSGLWFVNEALFDSDED